MSLTDSEKKAQKKYNKDTIVLSCSYKSGADLEDGKKIKDYLSLTGQTVNSYLKKLIKEDLEKNGFF